MTCHASLALRLLRPLVGKHTTAQGVCGCRYYRRACPEAVEQEMCALLEDFIRQDPAMVVASGSLMQLLQRLVEGPAAVGDGLPDNTRSPRRDAVFKARGLLVGGWQGATNEEAGACRGAGPASG